MKSDVGDEIEVFDEPGTTYARVRIREPHLFAKCSISLSPDQLDEFAALLRNAANVVRERAG